MKKNFKYREIPYNYTSFSDREIVLKYFDEETWAALNELRLKRITGRSSKLLFEVLGDIFIIERNPYIFNDFLENRGKQFKLKRLHRIRLNAIKEGTDDPLVLKLVEKTEKLNQQFFHNFSIEKKRRKHLLFALGKITSRVNVEFSAFHKVTHATDASDWRVEYPEVVVYPESSSQISGLVKAARGLDLKIIPRGGGTGLTGGAVPVFKNTMVVNTEKMRRIGGIDFVEENGISIPVVEVEAGVITDVVTDYCKEKGYIFATDPTSGWASTIGGNISENCGGKKCVMWGTAIDNLYSFDIINSSGERYKIKRRSHPYRKIHPDDEVIFDIYTRGKKKSEKFVKTISLKGTDIRKKGVGKDITNKALGGLPGLQKEGGDGIIVSARFVLYKPFKFKRTICLEFFGKNLVNASKAIVEIINLFEKNGKSFLTALEHFDEKYEMAINYRNKSERTEIPKAVLLIDVESDDEKDMAESSEAIIKLVKEYNTEGFIATNEKTSVQFWQDRKNLGAIAKHTNAFKLNEDVVIPIESLPDFADFIEMTNLRKQFENNSALIRDIGAYFSAKKFDDEFLLTKISGFTKKVGEIDSLFRAYDENIESEAMTLASYDERFKNNDKTVFEVIRDEEIISDIEKDLTDRFKQLFHGYDDVVNDVTEIVETRRSKKIIIATHMHAGDGNIHVNIPVHSSDYEMMQEADETAGIIMMKTAELGGVISGEHGIGLTKLKFIEQDVLDRYAEYKDEVDPDDIFNPGKLRSDFPLSKIFTPSFNLLEMEAFILEAADLENLSASIAGCVRCGKCKEVCNTHYPNGNMFYSPRNKILGVSLITEAVLYESQRSNSLSFRNFKMLREISDHCTMCHNCYAPCPVDIDFGNVSLAIKQLLVERKRAKFKIVTGFTLFYLRRRGYYINKVFRLFLLKIGFSAQRAGHYLNKPFSVFTRRILPTIDAFLKGKMSKAGEPTLRDRLDLKGTNTFFAFSNPEKEIKKSVVYFPGCGSERMFPEISMATIALLYEAGVRVVIAPEYLCCGYPLLSNGKVKQAEMKSYENRVIFLRMADIIGYMGIEDVIVSCGTCYEMLGKYQIENIFPEASIIDVNDFIAREGLFKSEEKCENLIYHDPCHSPLKNPDFRQTFSTILNAEPVDIPNCCGEGGTLALSTPEIANTIRERKKKNILPYLKKRERKTVLTTCPSCTQGLSKIDGNVSITGQSLVVYLAEKFLGKGWKKRLIKDIRDNNGVEKIIL